MSTQVEEIRRQIDTLDNKIHDLLMKRAELVIRIGKAKRENKIQFIQPAREAIMLRRLLGRHEGLLPKEAVVRIWRELVGAVSLLQTGLKVVVAVNPADTLSHWDMAKDYFSSVLPMKKVSDPLAALAAVRDGESSFAVLPWPEDGQGEGLPWWQFLMNEEGDNPMKIMARLPFGDRVRSPSGPEKKGVVIARVSFEPSGDDCSFIALELDSSISRARIVDKVKELKLAPLGLYSSAAPSGAHTLHLLEVKGYVSADDEKLRALLQKLDCAEGRGLCLGGYPAPPVYEDAVGKGAEEGRKENSAEGKKSA